jgi:hypothetical protein
MIRGVHYGPNRKKCEPRSELEITHPSSFVETHLLSRRVFGWYFPPVIKPGGGDGGVTSSIEIPRRLQWCITPQPRAPASAEFMTAVNPAICNVFSASESASERVMNE